MTYKQFCMKNKIMMKTEWADSNPNCDTFPQGSSHWKCILRRRDAMADKQMTVYYSMGPAHCCEPTVHDVINSLALDSIGVADGQSFEEWAYEYGYETDSRAAERTYKACKKQTARLLTFLGGARFKKLRDCEE